MEKTRLNKKRTRTSKVLISQLLLIHALYYGGTIGLFKAKSLLFEVVPGTVYRSGQPSLDQLAAWKDRYGFKTIVNLRGVNYDMYEEEKQTATDLGITMEYVDISAYRLVRHDRLCQMIEVLESAEKPMLIHCNHGVDRSGITSALAAWLVGDVSYYDAKWWSYIPPGPWKQRKKISPYHVSQTLEVYEDYCHEAGISADNPDHFKHWAQHVYRHVETNH